MKTPRIGTALFTCAALTLVAGPAQAKTLKKAQIESLLSGHSADWKATKGNFHGKMKWSADGSQTVTGNFKGFRSDTGHWQVKGDALCSSWTKIRGGREKCDPVTSLGGKRYQFGATIISMN